MRSKEEAHDYRYFPCPDLLPLKIEQTWIDIIQNNLPELPDKKKARFIKKYGITDYDASVLTAEVESAIFFEKVAKNRDGKISANWIINDVFGRLNKEAKTLEQGPISAEQLGSIIDLILADKISSKIAKDLFDIVWTSGGNPEEIVLKKGMLQVSDISSIKEVVDKVIRDNPVQVLKLDEAYWLVCRSSNEGY
jgi:aspartyl-tRNA(Asn)/glutamyl-tRNA(Gln) amidotransferase subunit B